MTAYARYIGSLAGFLAILSLVPALNYVVILRSGELAPLDEIVKAQHETGAIYGTGLHDVRGELPLQIIRHRQPEIVALGSSRAFDMRQEFFTRPFACACGSMDSIDDGESYVRALLRVAKPRLVLFSLDFWWFTTSRPQLSKPLQTGNAVQITRNKILRPTAWVQERTITPLEYLRLLGGERELHGVTSHPKIGVMAIKRSIGIRADGSQLHGIRLSRESRDFYAEARRQIGEAPAFVMGEGRYRDAAVLYGPDKHLVNERLDALDRVLAMLRAAGSEVILFQPPVAPPVAAALAATGRHGYLLELDRALAGRGVEYYNFLDPASLGVSGLCEFADAHHSGNATFLRILRAMLERNPGSPLARYVDPGRIASDIRRFAGTTIARFDADRYLAPEVDFLDGGCRTGRE